MFNEKKDPIYSEDLINSTEPIIIQQKSDTDKKFIYTLLILLVVLFIIALGVIAFLGAKYFGSNNNGAATQPTQQVVVQESKPTAVKPVATKPKLDETVKAVTAQKAAATQPAQPVQKSVAKKETVKEEAEPSLEELEQIVNGADQPQEPQQKAQPTKKVENAISAVAQSSAGTKLSPEEMAKIAKMVAAELAKMNQKGASNTHVAAKEDTELIQSLEQAQTDTLEEEKVDTQNLRADRQVRNTKTQKVDTFNKVIVGNKKSGDDELAALTQEIDALLQTEEVTKKKESLKYKKQILAEAKNREKNLRYIVVKPGDTLSTIAYRAYGRASAYVKIYEANPDLIKNPNRIYVGQRLRVPLEE